MNTELSWITDELETLMANEALWTSAQSLERIQPWI